MHLKIIIGTSMMFFCLLLVALDAEAFEDQDECDKIHIPNRNIQVEIHNKEMRLNWREASCPSKGEEGYLFYRLYYFYGSEERMLKLYDAGASIKTPFREKYYIDVGAVCVIPESTGSGYILDESKAAVEYYNSVQIYSQSVDRLNFYAERITDNSVKLKWKNNLGLYVDRYELLLNSSGGSREIEINETIIQNTNLDSYLVTGLQSGTAYDFKLTAYGGRLRQGETDIKQDNIQAVYETSATTLEHHSDAQGFISSYAVENDGIFQFQVKDGGNAVSPSASCALDETYALNLNESGNLKIASKIMRAAILKAAVNIFGKGTCNIKGGSEDLFSFHTTSDLKPVVTFYDPRPESTCYYGCFSKMPDIIKYD